MEITSRKPTVDEAMQLGYEAFQPQATEEKPTSSEIFQAAGRVENNIFSWVESLQYQSDEEDQAGYNVYDELSDEQLQFSDAYLDVRSPEQKLVKDAQIESYLHDRQTIAKGGAEGVAWSMAAGLADPLNIALMLVPGGMAVRAGVGAGKTAAAVAAGGAVEAGVSEAMLHSTQPLRTWQESLYAVGGTAL